MFNLIIFFVTFSVTQCFFYQKSWYVSQNTKNFTQMKLFLKNLILVAGITDDNQNMLNSFDDIFYNKLTIEPTVLILDTSDENKLLADLISADLQILNRDHEIPANPLKNNVLVAIFHEFEQSKVLQFISLYKSLRLTSTKLPPVAFAVTVKPALIKSMQTLCTEITNDFIENNKITSQL